MLRTLGYFGVVALLVAAAVWVAGDPGAVVLQWRGYRLETSFALLLAAVAAVAVAAALIDRLWRLVRRAPAALGRSWRERRRLQGYQALTRGMVAVAAGDAEEARRQVRRADVLLNEPPLTLLLSAQAAQLAGDEAAARRFFESLTERPETEFLGVRGLLTQAVKRGEAEAALRLARRAHRLRPKSEWVAKHLFDLEVRAGRWLDARVTSDEAARRRLIDGTTAKRRAAVLAYRMSLDAARAGDPEQAAHHAGEAYRADPGLIPAAAGYAAHLIAAGKGRKAAQMIETAWSRAPHPDLLPLYWQARGAAPALERVKATERLARCHPDHEESLIALAAAALEARLWGEARKHLSRAAGDRPTARVCRMMAELEDSEHGDSSAARAWLVRASRADPDPAWVCGSCGNAAWEWNAVCEICASFDSFAWREPPHAVRLAPGIEAASGAAAPPPSLPAAATEAAPPR